MNPGEIWRLDDDSLRVVVSNSTYNSSSLNRVISAVVGDPPRGFDPFAVTTGWGTAYADRLAMHPRNWLTEPVGMLGSVSLDELRTHLSFLLIEP